MLYGEPEMIQYDSGTSPRDPDLEIWIYPKTADASLNGDRPKRRYFFAEKDGKTVLYTPRGVSAPERPTVGSDDGATSCPGWLWRCRTTGQGDQRHAVACHGD